MRRHVGRSFVGVSLGTIGVAIVLVELLRRWVGVDPTGPHAWPVSIGAVFFVYGSYLCLPRTTKAVVTFIIGQGKRIVALKQTGRRSGDVVAITDDGEIHPPIAVKPVITHPAVPELELPPRSEWGDQ